MISLRTVLKITMGSTSFRWGGKLLPILFLNLLRSRVKWKLFYDAKTMFVSELCP